MKIKLTESQYHRVILKEEDGGLSMFKVGKRKKEMISLIKSTDDLLMSLIDFHDKYQEDETKKSYFQKFKTKARNEYDNFYRNPDLTNFQNPWEWKEFGDRYGLRKDIMNLYRSFKIPHSRYNQDRVGDLIGDCIKDVNRSMSGLRDGKDIESLPISHEWGDGRLNTFIAENPPIKSENEEEWKG